MSGAFLFGVSAVFHLYIAVRLLPVLALPYAISLGVLLAISTLLVPMGMLARRYIGSPRADVVAVAGLFFLGLFSSFVVATFLRDVLLIGFALVLEVWPRLATYSRVELASAEAVPVIALAVTLIGLVNARRIAGVVHVDIPIAGLPTALHGFAIVQISDVHVGPTIRRPYVEAIVAAVNALEGDVVAITGDLVDGSVPELRDHVEPLSRLSARHGSFFVTGNHEYYSGAVPWIEELQRLGVTVLQNEHVVIERQGEKLVLAGVPDYAAAHYERSHRSDPAKALHGAPADARAKVLLAHQPLIAKAAAQAGFDLQLSGHTHGGQFLPWNFFVRLQQPFTAGLYRLDALWVYVSRGTGYWGPPKRFGAPSEITRVRLIQASA